MPDSVSPTLLPSLALALLDASEALNWLTHQNQSADLKVREATQVIQGIKLVAYNENFGRLQPEWSQFLTSWPQPLLLLQGIQRNEHHRTLYQYAEANAKELRLLIDAYRSQGKNGESLLILLHPQKGDGLSTCDLLAVDSESLPSQLIDPQITQRFRQIVEDLIEGVYIVQNEKIVYANQSFAQSLGYSSEELLNLPSWHVIAAEREWPRLQARFQQQLRNGEQPFHGEFVTRHRDGSLRRLHHTLHTIQWDGQSAVQGTIIDLTELHHTQQSLQRRNERLALAVQGTSDGLWDWQIDTDQLWWSHRFYQLLGYTEPAYLPTWQQFWSKVHHEDLPQVQVALAQHLQTDHPFDILLRLQHLSGQTRYFRMRGRCTRNAQGVPHRMAGSLSDETEKRQEEMQRLRRHRLETMGQLTGGVAHDFNNLLQVVIGNLQLMEHHGNWDSDSRECLEAALIAAEEGANLTRQLLAFTRNQPLSRRAVNINEMLQRVARECRQLMPESIHFVLDLDPLVPLIAVDPAQLETTLLNLLINARDALPDGGVVRLISTAATVFNDDFNHPSMRYGRITVEDNGIGMDDATLNRVFEPFFTTKKIGQGSGLGLSSAYGFVKQSGGEMRIQSELGRGTTVSLDLPLATDIPAVSIPQNEKLTRQSARILVVEDQPQVRQFTVRCLEQLGYRVKQVANGVEALDYLKRQKPVDLVFTDMVMPGGVSGLDVCRWVKEYRPEIGLLLTTGFSPERLDICQSLGVLPKPYTFEQLAYALEREISARP